MENSDVFLGLHDFLDRMRQPSASEFVRSIKSFVVSFSNNAPDPDKDSAAVQEFFAKMEAAFRAHPLWSGCSEEELESAGEGLEKYVMTKLFTRVFTPIPDDVKLDEQLSEKIALVQQFIRPENLDIHPNFQTETSWLLAQKELQKINMYKAPRDKLVCILNCCKVINNLLLNVSMASNENPPGADEFLPVLIYVTIKANPPQLHSNLLYIQRYRRQSRLAGEAAYFFTNMLSAESFISSIDAKAISMDEAEFEKSMEFARFVLSGLSTDGDSQLNQSDLNSGTDRGSEVTETSYQALNVADKNSKVEEASNARDDLSMAKTPSLSDLENKGANTILKEKSAEQIFRDYPFLFARVGDLTISDVDELLNRYKQLVFQYVSLSKGLGVTPSAASLSNLHSKTQKQSETLTKDGDSRDEEQEKNNIGVKTNDGSDQVSLQGEENFEQGEVGNDEKSPVEV